MHVMGFKTKNVAQYVIEELELPLTAEEFRQEIAEIYRELFPQANPMPGNTSYFSLIIEIQCDNIIHISSNNIYDLISKIIGAVRLLKHLKENNVPIALATSSDQENYEAKTIHWRDLFELFDHKVIGGSDPEIVRGKPAPDIFLTAAKRFRDNPDPSKVMYSSDSLTQIFPHAREISF